MSHDCNHFYEFGPFRLSPAENLLTREGEPVPLAPKVFETLLVLVRLTLFSGSAGTSPFTSSSRKRPDHPASVSTPCP